MNPRETQGLTVRLREPGLRPLAWPPRALRPGSGSPAVALGAAWALTFLAACGLGYLSVTYGWYNYPVGKCRIGVYPPWTLGLLWTLWFGWAYGAAITSLICLILALMAPSSMSLSSALLLSCADAFGLYVFSRFLSGFPLDTRVRTLRDAGLFAIAVFLAAITGANGSFVVAYERGWLQAGNFQPVVVLWEGWWLGHFTECLIFAGPVATLLGPAVERWKARSFDCPLREGTFRRQLLAAMLGGLMLIVFYSILLQAPSQRVLESVGKWGEDDLTKSKLRQAIQEADQQRGIVLATLLGLGAVGVWLALALRRRNALQLRQEFQRHGDDLRKNSAWIQALSETSDDALHPHDTENFARRLSERLVRALGVQTVRVLLAREAGPALRMRLAAYAGSHAAQAPTDLPLEESLPGQAFQKAGSFYVDRESKEDPAAQAHAGYLQALGARAYFCIPLPGAHGPAGVLEAYADQPFTFDAETQRHLRFIARIGGAALERSRSGERERLNGAELAALSRLAQDLAEENDAAQLMQRIATAAVKQLGASAAAAYLLAHEPGGAVLVETSVAGTAGNKPAAAGFRVALKHACLVAECAREARTRSVGLAPEEPAETEVVPGWKAEVALAVPFSSNPNEPGGALALVFPRARKAGAEEATRAEELARQAGVGLRRLRLIEDTRRQAAEIALFEQIGRSFAEHLRLEDTLSNMIRNVSKVFPTRWAAVFELDEARQELFARAITIPHPEAPVIRIPVGARSLVAACFREGRTYVSEDLRTDPRSSPELTEKYGTRCGVVTPLGPPGKPFGVLFAMDPEAQTFDPDAVRRLEQIAVLATAALERSYLHEEVQRRADELALLHEVGKALVENPLLETSLQRIADIVRKHFHASGAGFLLASPDGTELIVHGIAGGNAESLREARVSLSEPGIINQAFLERKTIVVNDKLTDPRMGTIFNDQMPNARSGMVVPIQTSQAPVGIAGIYFDHPRRFDEREVGRLESVARLAASAVERQKLGRALLASEARINEILDSTPAVVISLDLTGRILSFNATAERITGYRRDEAVGRDCLELLYPEPSERKRVAGLLSETYASDRTGRNDITSVTTRDGKQRKIRWSGEFLHGPDGKKAGIVGMGIDVTDQVQLEAQFLQAQKMESVGALAGGMAHDFNNMLGGILGQAALAHAQLRPGDPLHKVLKKIESAAQRGADLTSKLLAFARRSVIQPLPVDLGLLTRETAELLAGSLPREITVISHVTPNLPPIEGDPTQLQQVLLNLCVNARDAMPEGGTLNLRVNQGDGGGVRLEIADTGTGMTAEVKEHLFEPFFTTKEKGKGTGLGLAVVFGIVRSHAGRIDLESAPGQGTRFILNFPGMKAKERTAGPEGATPSADGRPPLELFTGNEEILLIDDEAIMRESTQKLLESLGYRVQVATGGESGLELLDSGESKPKVIVLDVMMPGLAGVPLFHELRKRLPKAPVILISGFSREREVQLMLEAGAQELIQKPFRLEELATAIRRALQVPV
ncbi:MAG: GAF domain-containing protein [Planctomycetes bacterium]|nr:GAF domain-containing protein [Planctomycetota bacterium]